ncbi:MAG: 4'-phosphopantetheinyl transferase superfamily protein [Phycisphaerales bacterium]|nr:4'-phosphopantetheinyl transferase superfamily protein [Phycisphaerales bacterium]
MDSELTQLRNQLLIFACHQIYPEQKIQISDIKTDAFGKPFIPNSGFHFSISKTKKTIAVLISESNVGIDLVADIFFPDLDIYTQDELKILQSNKHLAPILFTRKEALLKTIGTGFRAEPKNIDVFPAQILFLNQTYYLCSFYVDEIKCTLSLCTTKNKLENAMDTTLYTFAPSLSSLSFAVIKKLHLRSVQMEF